MSLPTPPTPLARLSSRPIAVGKSGSSRAACSLFPLPRTTQCPPIPHFSPHPVLFPPPPTSPSTILSSTSILRCSPFVTSRSRPGAPMTKELSFLL